VSDLSILEKKIEVKFKNKDLLKQALTHRSYLNENTETGMSDNERLEFLGDAVLELIVTDHLYKTYKNPEGELTSWRASLVNADRLSAITKEIDLNGFLMLSRGESKDTGKARDVILANAIEAIIGAIYLDQGLDVVSKFIEKFIIVHLLEIIEKKLYIDSKSLFQEKAQEFFSTTPHYEVISEKGPDHKKRFVVGVYIEAELISKGEGSSKQEAQQVAAEKALEAKGWK